MPDRVLMLSVRPEYANAIFAGTKTVELRRVRPAIAKGDRIIVYVTAPIGELVGEFTVAAIKTGAPASLWKRVGKASGLSREDFLDYYAGARAAYAIYVSNPRLYRKPVSFAELRRRRPGFRPPQSYWYPTDQEYRSLCGT